MYPHTFNSSLLAEFDSELSAINDALRVAVLAVEIERTNMQQDCGLDDDLQGIMGLGVLLSDLQSQRMRAEKLTRALPSPICVEEAIRPDVSRLGKDLFEAIGHVENIQKEVYRMARANLKNATAKMNLAEDLAQETFNEDNLL